MIVLKLGGNALSKTADLSWISMLKERLDRGEKFVLIHGGGPQIDHELQIHSIEKTFIEGYRFTDEKTYGIVEMVLAGSVQQGLIRLFKSFGISAVGITGNDGATLQARKKVLASGVELGQVGEIEKVDTRLITLLLDQDYVPLLSPVSSDTDGRGFNINADLAAAAIAGALSAKAVIFMTDVAGIFRNYPDESSLIEEISISELSGMEGVFSGGMLPKVEAVQGAIESGAERAHVIDGRDGSALIALLQGEKIGTTVRRG